MYDLENNSVLSLPANMPEVCAYFTWQGRLFQASRAAAKKPRSPDLSLVRSRSMRGLSAERRRRVVTLSATGTTSARRYLGARLMKHLYTMIQILYDTR